MPVGRKGYLEEKCVIQSASTLLSVFKILFSPPGSSTPVQELHFGPGHPSLCIPENRNKHLSGAALRDV